MSTVLCHFYNEEYLLPWWIEHHKKLFQNGIMVNRGSTDRSVEIIQELAPDWKIIDSFSRVFDSALCDLEMSWLEKDVEGWKIVLNVTEFLVLDFDVLNLRNLQNILITNGDHRGAMIPGYIMVDNDGDSIPCYEQPLVSQKYYGLSEKLIDRETALLIKHLPLPQRSRLYHCAPIGNYYPGRHNSWLVDKAIIHEGAGIFWYGFSPWNEMTIKRKLQIKDTMSDGDIKNNRGIQHTQSLHELEEKRKFFLDKSTDLRGNINFDHLCTT